MKRALIACLVASAAHATPRSPHSLQPPAPVEVRDAVVVPGAHVEKTAAPSYAAPHRLLVTGDRLFLATDGGLAFVDASLRTPGQRVLDHGASLGVVTDLALVRGELWAATTRGVARVDARRGRVLGWKLSGRRVYAVDAGGHAATDGGVVDSNERVVAALEASALARCGSATTALANGETFPLDRARPAGTTIVTAIGCANGKLLVGTDAGLLLHAQTLGAGPVTAIAARGNAVAFGTVGDGLYLIEAGGTLAHPLPSGRVWSIAADGDAWLAAIDDALVRIGQNGTVERTLPWVGPRGLVTALAPDGDALWVGTFDDGLYRYAAGAYARVATPDLRISALLTGGEHLYVGTAAGLFVRDGDGRIDRVHDPRGRFLLHTSTLRRFGDRVLAGAYPGAVWIDGDARRYLTGRAEAVHDDEPMFATTVFGAAEQGDALWLATQDGVERHAPGSVEVFASIGGAMPDDWVNDIGTVGPDVVFALGDRGFGWMGPRGTRIYRARLPTATGGLRVLADRAIVAAADGLVVTTGDGPRLVRYGVEQGIDLVVGAIAVDDARDRVWLGGIGGVIRVDAARRQLAGADEPLARGTR